MLLKIRKISYGFLPLLLLALMLSVSGDRVSAAGPDSEMIDYLKMLKELDEARENNSKELEALETELDSVRSNPAKAAVKASSDEGDVALQGAARDEILDEVNKLIAPLLERIKALEVENRAFKIRQDALEEENRILKANQEELLKGTRPVLASEPEPEPEDDVPSTLADKTEEAATDATKITYNETSKKKQADGGLFISVDFLNWQSSVDDLEYAVSDTDTDTDIEGSMIEMDLDSEPAYRLKIGYRNDNNVDLTFGLTNFSESWSEFATAPVGGQLWAIRGHPADVDPAFGTATAASASFDIDYSVIDLELGYTLSPSEALDLRLFGGLRLADIDSALNIVYAAPVARTVMESNDISAFGLRVGAEGNYSLGSGFGLMTSLAASAMIAEIDTTRRGAGVVVDVNWSRNSDGVLIPVLESRVGVSWSRDFGSMAIRLTAGYEAESWLNAYRQYRFVDDWEHAKGVESKSDLGFHGPFFSLEGRF
jgi:hypothetical protein